MSEEQSYTKNVKMRPSIRQAMTVISRGSSGSMPGFSSQRSSTIRQSITPIYSQGTLSGLSHKGVNDVIEGRETEKKQMQGLNERFASYIEKVRFLEAQNKSCIAEIERLKKLKGFDAGEIKDLYQTELDECKRIIDDLNGQKSKFDSTLVGLQDALDDERRERDHAEKEAKELRGKIDKLCDQNGEYEGEISSLRGRINNVEDELNKTRAANKRLQDDLNRLRADLDEETRKRIETEHTAQCIEDDLTFKLNVAEAEIRELKQLIDRDKSVEIRNFWKGEIQNTIAALQKEYDNQLCDIRNSCEMKVQNHVRELQAGVQRDTMENGQLKEECKRLKSRIGETNPRLAELEAQCEALRRQLALLTEEFADYRLESEADLAKKDQDLRRVMEENEAILREFQFLQDAKLSMELEIATYRKLLDGEEQSLDSTIKTLSGSRSKDAEKLADIIQQSSMSGYQSRYGGGSGQYSSSGSGGMGVYQSSSSGGGQEYENLEDMQEAFGKATVTKSHRGPIAFSHASNQGHFVGLENVDKHKEQDLKNMCVVKIINKEVKCKHVFKNSLVLRPGQSVVLRSRKASDKDVPDASNVIQCDFNTWMGGAGFFALRDENGSDRATMDIKVT